MNLHTLKRFLSMADVEKKIKLEHFENLVAVAVADGHLDAEEKEFLMEKATEFGLAAKEVEAILSSPQESRFYAPQSQEEKEEQLSDVVFMAMIDGDVHEKEYALCVNFATRLGLSKSDVDEIIALAKKLSM